MNNKLCLKLGFLILFVLVRYGCNFFFELVFVKVVGFFVVYVGVIFYVLLVFVFFLIFSFFVVKVLDLFGIKDIGCVSLEFLFFVIDIEVFIFW